MQKLLSQLLPAFAHDIVAADGTTAIPDADVANSVISGLAFDSRDVRAGSLFFALPGVHIHGNEFIPEAIENGAEAIVFEGTMSPEIALKAAKSSVRRQLEAALSERGASAPAGVSPVFIRVPDARAAMAPISDAFYDSPSKKLVVIGVTGTEGKSSTVSFIWQLLRLCGEKAGFISTVDYSFGGEAIPNPQHQTTPEAPIVQHHLNAMLENGCRYAVIEASSHGLSAKTNRLGCVLFDCGVFMNVTLEHLEFHKTFEQYRKDKTNLFRILDKHDHRKLIAGERRKINSVGVVNLEDESAEQFIAATKKPIYGFTTHGKAGKTAAEPGGASAPPAIPPGVRRMTAQDISAARDALDFVIETDGEDAVFRPGDNLEIPRSCRQIQIRAQLPGAFNAYNIMAALIAVSSVTEQPFEKIAAAVPKLRPVKGRMTAVERGQPFEVIVDYAHTPSSFETIFPPVRTRCSGRMIAVFGSGGERDLAKRPMQGQIAARFCDIVILADEDPRGEDPIELLEMIAVGAEREGKRRNENLLVIHDRKQAIRQAFAIARPGDIVLLLGKSHENSIIYKDFTLPYDEIGEAEAALAELGFESPRPTPRGSEIESKAREEL